MATRARAWWWVPVVVLALGGCGAAADEDDDLVPVEDAVTVDTSTAAARAQYDANVAFLQGYRARCAVRSTRPRVLVTGFGRFLSNRTNATGQMVSLLAGAEYPLTEPPARGAVDPAGPQTRVTQTTVTLPGAGAVDVCAMVLPVYWDLAAILVARELDAFKPRLVVMNGIAGAEQDLWIELGGVNRAMTLADGSDLLRPRAPAGLSYAPLVPSASAADAQRGLVLSWAPVQRAALAAITERAEDENDAGRAFGDVARGAKLGGYPRGGNTYLCNNVSYTVNYLMAYPGRTVTLLQASPARRGAVNRVAVRVATDLRASPRVFVHWPSALTDRHLASGVAVLRAMIDAQLTTREAPTAGDNRLAEVAPSGDTF